MLLHHLVQVAEEVAVAAKVIQEVPAAQEVEEVVEEDR